MGQSSVNKTTMPSSQMVSKNKGYVTLPVHDFYSRMLAYIAVAGIIITGAHTGMIQGSITTPILITVIYPLLVQFLTHPVRKKYPYQTRLVLIYADAILAGLFLVYIKFAFFPTLLMLIMINTGFIVVGSITAWAFCVIIHAIGILIGSQFFPFEFVMNVPMEVTAISAVGVGIHLAVTAYYTHRQAVDLMEARTTALKAEEDARRLSHKVSKYISPQIWESIFSGRQEVKLTTQRKKLTVFFSDIKGFTSISEQMEPEALTEMLNNYLTEMSKIVLKHGGTIDKFIGDSIMVFFGDPKSRGVKKDAIAAVSMAVEMRKQMRILQQQWRSQGIQNPLEIRMGINTGYCTVGNFGAESRMDYTIIGKEVNLASRLESAADSGEILVSYETYQMIKDRILCREHGTIKAKGFSKPIPVYVALDFRKDLGADKAYIETELPGFSMYMDSTRIPNYERDKVVKALEDAAVKMKKEIRKTPA